METYIQLEFVNITPEQNELLIALLTEIDFIGFEEKDNILKAYTNSKDFDEPMVQKIAKQFNIQFTRSNIKETNWNQVWESNFQPVTVEDFCAIRAGFHNPIKNVQHEIVITPKMSFGTGHHPTTYMMVQQMKKIDFVNKYVIDFGTGTGILAILAEKLGAQYILAIDNDEKSIENATENVKNNNCRKIDVVKTPIPGNKIGYDIILANINKQVIIDNLSCLFKQLNPQGIIVISGLLTTDHEGIFKIADETKLSLVQYLQKRKLDMFNVQY